MEFHKLYPLVDKLHYYHQFRYLDTDILQRMENTLSDIPLKKASKDYMTSLIKSIFIQILYERYHISVDSTKQELIDKFGKWFSEINSKCKQLGCGYRFDFEIGSRSPIKGYNLSAHHWGLPSTEYDKALIPSQEIIMIGYVLDVIFCLSDICRTEVWGN